VLTGAADNLPRVRLAELKDGRDLPVRVVERLAKDERGAFRWRQLLQQQQNRELQRLAPLHSKLGIGAGVDRFVQPRADVPLSPRPSGLGHVKRQSCGRRGEERWRVLDDGAVGDLPPQPGLLHDVLGL